MGVNSQLHACSLLPRYPLDSDAQHRPAHIQSYNTPSNSEISKKFIHVVPDANDLIRIVHLIASPKRISVCPSCKGGA